MGISRRSPGQRRGSVGSTVSGDRRTEALGRRERGVIWLALVGVTLISWLYLLILAGQMMPRAMAGMAMPMPAPWTAATFALTFVMWWVMMLGMMLPSAAPMILMFASLNRNKAARGGGFVPTFVFTAGYLLVWGGFSLAATVAQWGLEGATLLSPMMRTNSVVLGAALLAVAGLYQFSPWKQACLHHCRSPFAFVMNHWRDGWGGALRMGCEHGLYCLGCCAVLMALLFVVGVMNLLWVAAIAAFVFAEKLFPRGAWIARVGGLAMLGFGVFLVLG